MMSFLQGWMTRFDAGGVPPHPYCASALGNRTRWNHSLSFTIPPAWLRHAVPPLHKGGLFFAQANTTGKGKESFGSSVTLVPCRDGHIALPRWAIEPGPVVSTWQGLHAGPYRCWLASTGAGSGATHDAGDRNGRPDTGP